MVDLKVPAPDLQTAEAPQSRVGGDAFQRTPQTGIGGGLEALGQGADELATSLAKAAGTEAGKQAVTLDANGQPQVATSLTSPILLGRAGPAYENAMRAAIEPTLRAGITQAMTTMRQEQDLDPNAGPQDWLKKVGDFAGTLRTKYPGPLGETAFTTAVQQGTQHYANIIDQETKTDISQSKQTIDSDLNTAQNRLFSLARQGVSGTPAFAQARDQFDAAYQKLSDNADMFGLSADAITANKKKAELDLVGHGAVGAIDRAFADPGPNGGVAGAQKIVKEQITNNPALNDLSLGERTRLETIANSRIEYNKAENLSQITGNAAASKALIDGYASGDPRKVPDDQTFQTVLTNAQRLGDVDSVAQLNAARKAYETRAPLTSIGVNAARPTADAVHGAIIGQESGGNPNVGKSVTGATGIGQIQPATFATYAQPGEKIDNPADNLAVSKRIIADYYQRYNGDPQRIAVAYFSGPGNVAPAGSPTPWIADRADPTGKTTSSYVSDIASRLGGGAPIVHATAAEIKQNPYIVAAAYRQYDADKAGQVQTAQQTATAVGSMMRAGVTPSVEQMAQVVQAGQAFPKELGNTANELMRQYAGHTGGVADAQLPAGTGEARQAAVDQYVRANPNIAGVQYMQAYNTAFNADRKRQTEEPQQYAASVGWRGPVQPLTPGDPQAFAAQVSDRVAGSHYIANRLGQAPEAVTFGAQDKSDIANFLQSAPGPQARAAMQTLIGGLSTAAADQLFRDKDTLRAVIAMSKSDDTDKIAAAGSAMDAQYRRDPAQFDAQFPHQSAWLHDYQERLGYYTPQEIAKQNLKANDPAQATADKAKEKIADDATKLWTADYVAKQFGSGITSYIPGLRSLVGSIPSAPPEFESAKGAMLADAQMLYRDGFVQSGDDSQAKSFMLERLANKYSVSGVNGNRVMPFAPEKRFEPINGSHQWVTDQLGEFVQRAMGGSAENSFARNAQYAQPSAAGYQTKLSPSDEEKFRSWVSQNNVPFDPNNPRSDYDMRGFWQSDRGGQARNANDGLMHFPDTFKTPYHESFSNESKYATADAPKWNNKDQLVDKSGNVVFDERNRAATKQAASLGLYMPLAEGFAPISQGAEYFPTTTAEQTAYAKAFAPRMLFSDQDTQADIAAGRAPSYAVIAADPNGRTVPLTDTALKPLRFTPDYNRALGEWNAIQAGRHPAAQRANATAIEYATDAARGGG